MSEVITLSNSRTFVFKTYCGAIEGSGYKIMEISDGCVPEGWQVLSRLVPPEGTEEVPEVLRILEDSVTKGMVGHYVDSSGNQDYLDHSYNHMPFERWIGAIQWTIGKYFDRFGRKDDLVKEAYKIKDYADRFYQKVVKHVEEQDNK